MLSLGGKRGGGPTGLEEDDLGAPDAPHVLGGRGRGPGEGVGLGGRGGGPGILIDIIYL